MPAITTTVTAAAVASSASLLSLLFPYISPQPLGSFFCFIFLFRLLTASFSFIHIRSCSRPRHASPSSSPCHAPPLRHALPSPSPCRAAFAASPLACVASVASRLRHASPVSHRAFIMRRLFCVALRVSHRHVATLVRACRVMLSHAPSPHAPFSPHIRADLRVLSLVSRRFCNTAQLELYCTLKFSPTDVDVTCMHSMACKGAASCGALFAPPDDTIKRKTGRSSPPKPISVTIFTQGRPPCLRVPVVVLFTVQLLLNINILKTFHTGHGNPLSLHDGTTPAQKKPHPRDPYPWEKRQFLQQGPPEALS